MQSVKINKGKCRINFAIGFWWQIQDGTGNRKAMLAQARRLAEDFPDRNYNCLVPRKQQFGLGFCESAKIKRLPSLACALVERSWSTWIGIFRLERELWWVCAVSKKTIVAEGDQYFSSRAEAEAHFKDLKSMSSWDNNEVVCETIEDSMDHFNGLLRVSERVLPLASPNNRGRLILMVAILSLLGCCWFLWNSHQQELLKEKQRIAALEAMLKQKKEQVQIQNNPSMIFSMDWKETPLPSSFAYQFIKTVRNSEPYTLGWKLKSIIRNSAGIYMSWQHQQGAQFTTRPGNSTLEERPELAEITIAYPETENRPEQSLSYRSDATARLYELTRTLGARLNLSWKTPEIKKLSRSDKVSAPWTMGEWKLSALPAASAISAPLFTELDTIPCLVLSKIDLTENQCSMEGRIYALY